MQNTKHIYRNILAMLGIFLAVDFVLFLAFGVLFLDGMEFSGIRMLSENAPVIPFKASDYFFNCTLWCMLEDLAITILYYQYILRHPERINKQMDVVYFWLIHMNIKIFLNLHSTAQFLGVLEYARESRWREFLLTESDFIKPMSCFVASRNSILMSLSVILITFWILLHYPEWKCTPFKFAFPLGLDLSMFLLWNTRISTMQKIVIILILVILLGITVLAIRNPGAFRTGIRKNGDSKPNFDTNPDHKNAKDLHKYVRMYAFFFLGMSILWALIRFVILPSENKNSLFGMQYSAILKLLTPIFVIFNLLLEKIEKSNPEKYIQHPGYLYQSNALILILTGCFMLMLFGEFGSVVCILALTMIIYLLLVDFSGDLKSLKYKIPISLMIGILLGSGLILIENAFLQISIHTGSGEEILDLGGEIFGISLNHWGVILAGILAIFLLMILYCREFVTLLPFRLGLKFRINILNFLEKRFRKVNIHFLHPGKKNQKFELQNMVSICIIIPVVGFLVIYYNFFLNAYSGRTVLKNYYMTAGNFSNEFEITENITQKRASDVSRAISMQNSGEVPEIQNTESEELPDAVKQLLDQQSASQHAEKEIKEYFDLTEPDSTLAELENYYPTKFYTGYYLKLMQVIDRLCYSSRTAELSAVQKGLKQNMGFDIQETSQNRTYISSLQRKYFVTKQDVQNAAPEVQEIYCNPDGTFKDTFFILNQNGTPAKEGETEYIWYYEDTKIPYGVTYHDQQTVIYEVDAKELQRIFKYSEPMTAGSDYVLYTLSRMGVGNVLLLIFIPYFFMIVLLLATNMHIILKENTDSGYFRYVLHQLGTIYAISFMIQTIVIVWGVFGVSLFSGLSLPLVASGNFEMFLNSICTAVIFISVGNPNQIYSDLSKP